MKKIRAGLVGSAGLSAGVLIKILAAHKRVQLAALVSDSHSGMKISDIHRGLKGLTGKKAVSYDPEKLVSDCDVIFFSKPHIENMKNTTDLVTLAGQKGRKVRFIDLSGDFRLKNTRDFEEWYIKRETKSKLKGLWKKQKASGAYKKVLKAAVYGLSEVNRAAIRKAYFIANPGCYPTGALLGILPLVLKGVADRKDIVINACSGVSGAGRTRKPGGSGMAVNMRDNIIPYKIAVHQHIPEIEQELSTGKGRVKVSFAPHVVSFDYGILTTISLKSTGRASMQKINSIYRSFYRNSHFIRITGDAYPQVKNVVGTNFCDIGFKVDERNGRLVVVTAIDNLYKGASGQAVQNMNIMFGLRETEGL